MVPRIPVKNLVEMGAVMVTNSWKREVRRVMRDLGGGKGWEGERYMEKGGGEREGIGKRRGNGRWGEG